MTWEAGLKCTKARKTEWGENTIRYNQHGRLRTASDQMVSSKSGVFPFLSLIKTHNISPNDCSFCASLALFSPLNDTKNEAPCL